MSFFNSSAPLQQSPENHSSGRDADEWSGAGDSANFRMMFRSPGLSDRARDDWVKSLQAFMNRRGTPLPKIPIIAG
jgi:hypothetical protein